jgi:hypothetical protein
MINIVVTSKPVDGLLYYSYEYCSYLNAQGIDARVVIICHRKFTVMDYVETILCKYTVCENVVFNNIVPDPKDITLVMGRSMITLSWQDFGDYRIEQQDSLRRLFAGNVISVYSENHPAKYPLALEFYNPQQVIDLCDTEVYPNGVGEHFEKRINFEIYKPYQNDLQFKYLFLGTNDKYYAIAEKYIKDYPDHGILTYNTDYVNIKNNNIFVPVTNLIGLFDTYVYVKDTFDPAPRIIQECKYYSKDIIYLRDKAIVDGGSVYMNRNIQEPDITPIISAVESFR